MVVINGRILVGDGVALTREPSAQEELPLLWAVSDARGRAELDALVADAAKDEN